MKKTLVNLVINIFSFIEGKTSKDEYGHSALKRMGYFFKYDDKDVTLEYVYLFPFEFVRVEAEAQKIHSIKFKPSHKRIKL